MAIKAGEVVTEVLRRVRDEQGAGHTRTFTLEIIGHCQRLLNRVTRSVTVENTLTLQPKKLIYDLTGSFPDSLSVISAKYRGEDLISTQLPVLANIDVSWPRNVSGEPRVFSQAGLDLLVVYPVPDNPASLTLTSVKEIGLIPGESTDMSLPDHAVPLIKDLATVVLLVRQRDLEASVKLLQSVQENLKGYRNE